MFRVPGVLPLGHVISLPPACPSNLELLKNLLNRALLQFLFQFNHSHNSNYHIIHMESATEVDLVKHLSVTVTKSNSPKEKVCMNIQGIQHRPPQRRSVNPYGPSNKWQLLTGHVPDQHSRSQNLNGQKFLADSRECSIR
jgi:hypothetical protein